MGQIKRLLDETMTTQNLDVLYDEDYEQWLLQKQKEQEAYEEMLEINPNYANN